MLGGKAFSRFSPLFIGETPATGEHGGGIVVRSGFSPLFIGETPATQHGAPSRDLAVTSFSPLFIGETPATRLTCQSRQPFLGFSPLFIGETPATLWSRMTTAATPLFQSPIHRGNSCNSNIVKLVRSELKFQSPIHRGNSCNHCPPGDAAFFFISVSVPYSSGKLLQLQLSDRRAANE